MIDRGDLPSLVAVALQPDPGRLILYYRDEPDVAAKRRAAAVQDHDAAYGVRRVIVCESGSPGITDHEAAIPTGLEQAHLLLHAVVAAGQLGCSKIVWPTQVGPDAGLVGVIVQRANMVVDLAQIGIEPAAGGWPVIDLPVVDLTDKQLVDLTEDTGAPMRSFWPCDGDGESPCGSCPSCQRWQCAFDEAGVPWPWVAVGI